MKTSLAELVWHLRSEEQVYSGQTDHEIKHGLPPSAKLSGRICPHPDCNKPLALGNQSGVCRLHNKGGKVSSIFSRQPQQPAKEAKPAAKQFRAYTMIRRKDGWAIVTVMASETDIVNESDVDMRQTQIGHLINKFVRLE